MKNNKTKLIFGLLAAIVILAGFTLISGKEDSAGETLREISPRYGTIQRRIETAGEVLPQNRLEIKPPIAGRIEKILVREGDTVKVGDILALMSSTERAALLDAARLQNETEVKYWEDVYKVTPLIAPIDGKVIVRSVEPGQTVVAGDAVIVLSDRLIVKANFDEVDIGRIKEGQKAVIGLDAYPEIEVDATVDHISHESTLVNNVTIYQVDILPEQIPDVFRSGMSSNVNVIIDSRENALIIPLAAVVRESNETFVLLKGRKDPVRQKVRLGLADEENVEVLSGLTENDVVMVSSRSFSLPQGRESGSNPFMPRFGGGGRR